MKTVWLASYPKSGNTWMRFLLAHLLYGNIEHSADIQWIVPDIHKPAPSKMFRIGETCFRKTHRLWDETHPDADNTIGAVYLVRNPLDVLCSLLAYNCPQEDTTSRQHFIYDFLVKGGSSYLIDFHIGTWNENVSSWCIQEHAFPIHIIRYEDLLKNTAQELKAVSAFIGLDVTNEAIESAVAGSSFERMRSMEEIERKTANPGFFQAVHQEKKRDDFRFVNKGTFGQFQHVLSQAEIQFGYEKLKPVMDALGYQLR
jgi:hypothetical protein